jgi:hypothetical protein
MSPISGTAPYLASLQLAEAQSGEIPGRGRCSVSLVRPPLGVG